MIHCRSIDVPRASRALDCGSAFNTDLAARLNFVYTCAKGDIRDDDDCDVASSRARRCRRRRRWVRRCGRSGAADKAAAPSETTGTASRAVVAEKVRARERRKTVDGFWFITDLHITAKGAERQGACALTPIRSEEDFCAAICPRRSRRGSSPTRRHRLPRLLSLFLREPIEGLRQLLYTAKATTTSRPARREVRQGPHLHRRGGEARVMGSKGFAGVSPNGRSDGVHYTSTMPGRSATSRGYDGLHHPKRSYWAVRSGMGPRS